MLALLLLKLCSSIKLFLILMPWWFFFFPRTHSVPSLSLRPCLTFPPLIPYMDLVFPCLRPQPWFMVSLLHSWCAQSILSISVMGLHRKAPHRGPFYYFYGPLWTSPWTWLALAHDAFLCGFTFRFYVHSGQGVPPDLSSILSNRARLNELTYPFLRAHLKERCKVRV